MAMRVIEDRVSTRNDGPCKRAFIVFWRFGSVVSALHQEGARSAVSGKVRRLAGDLKVN